MVSVIVPVYNTEKYIEACVMSILSQTYSDIEILLINDGSTDQSGHIIDDIAKRDSRISVFHTGNRGVAAARNFGIAQSKGEYIAFLDSDDLMDAQFIEKAISAIKDSDYVSCAFKTFDENSELALIDYMSAFSDSVSIEDYLHEMLKFQAGAYWGANWGKLYNSQIIKHYQIQFEPDVQFAEDFRFNLSYLKYVQRIALIHDPVCSYRVDTADSLSKKSREPVRYWDEYCELYNRYVSLYKAHGILDESSIGLSSFLIGAYASVLMECVYWGKMTLRATEKVRFLMEGSAELQRAANICTRRSGQIGRYARWIMCHCGQLVVIEMKIKRLKRLIQ